MPARLLVALCFAFALLSSTAVADGPFEPNETAATATGPVTQSKLDAGLETPQDEDWYLLHPGAPRQIGVLGMLGGECPHPRGGISVRLLDGDVHPYSAQLDSFTLGYDAWNAGGGVQTAQQLAFTSIPGHRYFLHVTQSRCYGVPYQLSIGPGDALGTKLADTKECADAKRAAKRARKKAARLRKAYRRARGVRRTSLRSKYVIQKQSIPVADSAAKSACTRRVLTGYPWE